MNRSHFHPGRATFLCDPAAHSGQRVPHTARRAAARAPDRACPQLHPSPPRRTGRHLRWHPVEAHVCRSRRKGSTLCEHEFDREEIPHFCTLCGYPNGRGDRALGKVYGPRRLTARETNR